MADSNNHRIQVFTTEGEFLRMFGQKGRGRGELYWPSNIALDPSNSHVFISDRGNQRVSVFTVEGQFVTLLDCGFCPVGLAVDNCGVVYYMLSWWQLYPSVLIISDLFCVILHHPLKHFL